MKLHDFKIGMQLRLGLGLILLLMVALGSLAWLQADKLWEQTKGLYEHSLQVGQAVAKLEAQIAIIHRDMRNLCLTLNESERAGLLDAMAASDALARQQLAIVNALYLGPRSDVEKIESALEQWQLIRAETLALLRQGKTDEALERTRPGGIGFVQTGKVLAEIQDVSEFTKRKAELYYQNCQTRQHSFKQRLSGSFALALLLSLGVGGALLRQIKVPLAELTVVARQFRQGQLDARSRHESANEFGVLASAFNAMAEALQAESRRTHEFTAQLACQNDELKLRQHELASQRDSLSAQNRVLETQKLQLDEANRLKSRFLANMSHELRTPLNSVIALSNVLQRRLAGSLPAEECGYLEIIERNGKNLLALINDILDLSRIEAGREDLSLSAFPVREWLDETLALFELQAREKHLTLTCSVDPTLPPLVSARDKCRHILQNLVDNALKFTASGSVTLAASHAAGYLELTVRDTGIGIAAEHLPHIFDEFRQADSSTSRRYGGTGLGLTIARKYARLLGGDLTVASAPDQGSTFTLRLPLCSEPPAGPPQGADDAGAGKEEL